MESKQAIIIVVALLIILGGGYWFLQSQEAGAPSVSDDTATTTQENTQNNTSTAGPSATLSVQADKTSYAVGDTVSLSFYVDSPVPVDGADVTFTFDNTTLELTQGLAKGNFSQQVSQIAQVGQTQKTQGTPVIQYATSTKSGNQTKYSFSALALPGEGMSGMTKLGTITLRAKKAGDAPITISFEKAGVSTDSNIAYEGRDILKAVEGTTVRVQSN